MKKTFSLLSILAKSLFVLLVFFDLLLIAKVTGEFATHGITGVRDWIVHIGSEGRVTIESSGPGLFIVHFPPPSLIFREFFTMCGILLVLTPLSYWVGRFLSMKAR